MNTASHYTFGDGDVARDRLRLLAEAFEPSSRALIARLPALAAQPGEAALAVDLGCGAGYTTDLLRGAPGVGRVVGVDRSPRLLDAARARLGAWAEVVEHDVALAPLPLPPARLLYARFLLTHLRDVTQVLVGWRTALEPGGLVVLEETAYMTSEHPALRRYYALVERMQAYYGQAMYIGRSLDEAARLAGLATLDSRVADLELPAARMARLHALNLRTWKDDPFAQASFDPTELAELSTTLGRIATGDEPASAVSCGVKQIVSRRDDAGSSAANTKANATNPAHSAAR
jgi:trans-aconitate 2-methyltransferase